VKKCKAMCEVRDSGAGAAILGAGEVPVMNARFAHVLSRLSIVSVVAVSGLGAAACSRAPSTSSEATPSAEATSADTATPAAGKHTPGQWLFRQVEALDLRPEQSAAVADIKQNLVAAMEPHRETVRQVAGLLAQAIEDGQLDPAESAAHQAALQAALADVKVAFADAINGVHDVLDAGQRTALVANLEEMHQRSRTHGPDATGAEHQGGIARLAFELGLSEEQKASIHDAMQKGVDDIFPDRKARREATEARMKAMRDAFVTDAFDAAEFDMGSDAEHAISSFITVASRGIDIAGQVLSYGQRQAAADLIRSHAERF
jgi:Spy/CpxP family protein refolding chaperone